MKKTIALVFVLVLIPLKFASAADGLVTKPSAYSASVTLERLEAALKERHYVVFAKLDHAAAANAVGLKMPSTTVLVFGNPRGGTQQMLAKPTLAIDLPLKALVWENAEGKVMVTYNSGEYVAGTIFPRHGLPLSQKRQEDTEGMLNAVTNAATK